MLCGGEVFEFYILRWDIVHRRMTRLQDALRAMRICNDNSIKDDLDVFVAILKARRAWIVPHRFLPRPWFFNSFLVHW